MKKKLVKFITCTLIATLFSCTSDEKKSSENVSLDDENILYLKSYKQDVAPSPGYYDSFFEYNNGFLLSGTGYNFLGGTFKYDNSGKLISRQINNQIYSYTYDSQNRLLKEIKDGSNDNITISYIGNKITFLNSHGDTYPYPYNEISEIYLDDLQRIIKTKRVTETSTIGYTVREYSYDSRNNITQLVYKESNSSETVPDKYVNYQYDDKKNPFYYAYKKLYKSIYYLECRNGIANYKQTGVTPNNLTALGSSETFIHTYNNYDFPVKYIQKYDNGGQTPATLERTMEYY
ncbi:hypothetical protein ACFX5E_09565 [Flavobacterium sp. LS2P90]|uniref:YD repeat-containing protein n=1 Tax=Flavobacterium xylosi TaxID=3230415 RepID=A0ABW6HX73_9FLAO